jgi:DNA-binding SARP family transcriptional activator
MASGFSFAVLGPVRAWHDGDEIDVGGPQQRAVLAIMLLRAGAYISTDELVDTLWPDDPPKSATGIVRTYVYRLRKALGSDKLLYSVGGYALAMRGDEFDVARFKGLVDQAGWARSEGDIAAAVECLNEALSLWKGTPLAGVSGRFAETRGALLEEMRLAAAEDYADDSLTLRKHLQAIPTLASLAAEYPYRERLRSLLMLALYRAGRQAEALAVFDEVRRLFSAELGIDPGPQLQDVHLRILNADPALLDAPAAKASVGAGGVRPYATAQGPDDVGDKGPAPSPRPADTVRVPAAPPAQLPRDLPTFAGRSADVESVVAGFTDRSGSGGVTVITGMAGVGKTTLSVHAAHLLAGQFPDGQLYVDLRGFDRSGMALSAQDAIRQLLAGLGVPPGRIPFEEEAQVGLYRSTIAGRRVLIVLDNARGAEQVRPLLPGDSRCHVLVTSRDQMRSLIATEGAQLVGLSPLSKEDAREALSRRLGAARADAEADAVERLIELCGGLPLALSVVAARAATYPTHSLSSLATELSESGNSLTALADPDSAVDARASLSLSYRALSPEAARLLRLSSLHPGAELSREAMASMAAIDTVTTAAVLDELERVHLMTRPEPAFYASHGLVRAFASELADADPPAEMDYARRRMLDHYRKSALEAMRRLRPVRSPVEIGEALPGVTAMAFDGPEDSFAWFARMYPVLRVLLEQSVEFGLPEYTWQLAWALDPFHTSQARWLDKIAVHRLALAAAVKLADPTLQAHSHRNLGEAFKGSGDDRQAMRHLELAQRLYDELGNWADQARNLTVIVSVMLDGNLPDQAKHHALRAVELSVEMGGSREQAVAYNNLACAHRIAGDQVAAIQCAERALALLDESGEVAFRASVLSTLGQSQCRFGDYEQGLDRLLAALDIFRTMHDRREEVRTLRVIATAQRTAGNLPAARHAWQSALLILTDLGRDLPAFDRFTLEGGDRNLLAS